jgi:sulfur-oxidizing protein SoxZ
MRLMAAPKVNRRHRVRVPRRARRGEIIEIKAMIRHPMITGRRIDQVLRLRESHIINRFTCIYNGATIIDAELNTGVSADPYFAFYARAEKSGTFQFTWYDDDGSIYRASAPITVS